MPEEETASIAPESRVKPNRKLIASVGFMVGLMLGVFGPVGYMLVFEFCRQCEEGWAGGGAGCVGVMESNFVAPMDRRK